MAYVGLRNSRTVEIVGLRNSVVGTTVVGLRNSVAQKNTFSSDQPIRSVSSSLPDSGLAISL